jgi:hypothetical protein
MISRIINQVGLEMPPRGRLLSYGVIILLALLMTACGGPETTAVDTPTPAVVPPPQIQPTPPPADAYPGPSLPATPVDGYPAPAPPPAPALPSGYPGEAAWFLRPAGLQCEAPLYPDLEAAVAALEAAGVSVSAAETVTLPVCAACGCPTSEHYRVEIPTGARNVAMVLEWTPE